MRSSIYRSSAKGFTITCIDNVERYKNDKADCQALHGVT